MSNRDGKADVDARHRLTEALVATGGQDRAAFAKVYRLSSAKLFGICLRICGNRQAAEDVLQEVYVTIWRQAGGYDPGRASPITWLATVARNRAIDWRRARANAGGLPLPDDLPEVVDPSLLAPEAMLVEEADRRLHHCLGELDEGQRDAIRTAFFDGLTYTELADRAAVPLGTMKSRIRRGLGKLRSAWAMTEEDRVEAGELALGVLEGDARSAALRRVLAEPGFAAEVTRWRRHLAGLIGGYPDVAPPDALEPAIVAEPQPMKTAGSGWRVGAIAASALAASLALIIAWPKHPAEPPAPAPPAVPARMFVAALGGEGAKPFTAVYDERAARVSLVGAAAWPADRSAELWVIAPGRPPRPLGLLTRGERSGVAVAGDARAAMAAGVTLAVSIEPAGGSPTGLPTGPVVASGGLVAG